MNSERLAAALRAPWRETRDRRCGLVSSRIAEVLPVGFHLEGPRQDPGSGTLDPSLVWTAYRNTGVDSADVVGLRMDRALFECVDDGLFAVILTREIEGLLQDIEHEGWS